VKASILALTLGLLAVPAWAQTAEVDQQARAIILPVIEANVQQMPGANALVAQRITDCILQAARPEEKAALAQATEPSQALADQIILPIMGRPEVSSCLQS
jgi:hypothetical protein